MLKEADEDPNNVNNVIEIYTGRSIAKPNKTVAAMIRTLGIENTFGRSLMAFRENLNTRIPMHTIFGPLTVQSTPTAATMISIMAAYPMTSAQNAEKERGLGNPQIA